MRICVLLVTIIAGPAFAQHPRTQECDADRCQLTAAREHIDIMVRNGWARAHQG